MKRRISSARWPESRKCFASVGCALLILVHVVVLCCSSRNVKLKKKKFSPYHYYILSFPHIQNTHFMVSESAYKWRFGLLFLSPYTQNHSISNFMQQETFHKTCWIAVPNFCSQVHSSSTISFTWLADCTC